MSALSSRMQTAVVLTGFDAEHPASMLTVKRDKPVPRPREGEVLVRVAARPVNPADVMSLKGTYPGFKPQPPAVPGIEGAGVVEELGNGVSSPPVGSRGFFWPRALTATGEGSWQQFVSVPAENFVRVPDTVEFTTAANIYVNGATAWGLLATLAPPPGAWVLQSAAGSTLGRMVIQLAKVKGYRTLNVVRRQEQVGELMAIGADAVLWSDEAAAGLVRGAVREGGSPDLREISAKDFASAVEAATGCAEQGGVWGALDPVCGDSTLRLASAVRAGGQVLVFGALGGGGVAHVSAMDFLRGVTVKGFLLGPWFDALSPDHRRTLLAEIVECFASGKVTTAVGQSFPLEEAAAAVEKSVQPGRGGKVMLVG